MDANGEDLAQLQVSLGWVLAPYGVQETVAVTFRPGGIRTLAQEVAR